VLTDYATGMILASVQSASCEWLSLLVDCEAVDISSVASYFRQWFSL